MNSATDPNDPGFQFSDENESEFYIEPAFGFPTSEGDVNFECWLADNFALIKDSFVDSERGADPLSGSIGLDQDTPERICEVSGLRGSSSSSLFLNRQRKGRLRRKPARFPKVSKTLKKPGREYRLPEAVSSSAHLRVVKFLETYIYYDKQRFAEAMHALPLGEEGVALVKTFFRERIFKYSKANKNELKSLYEETDEDRFKQLALKFHGSMGHQKMGNILRALFPKIVTYIMKLSRLDHVPMPDHDQFNGINYATILGKFNLTEKFLLCLDTPELKDYLNNVSKEIFRSNCHAWAVKLNQNPKADIRMGVLPSDCEAALRVFAFQVRGLEG